MANFVYVDGVLSGVWDGQAYSLTPEHPAYAQVKLRLKDATEKELAELVRSYSVSKVVSNCSGGRAELRDDVVYLDGKAVHNAITKRAVELAQEGLPFEPLLRFMENISKNPSYKTREEQFDFLEHKGHPITEDGCFLAYKAVRNDYMDKHSGTFSNKPGTTVSMNRSEVDDNHNNHCSKGLHVGSMEYVAGFRGGDDRIVIVKVNPADVVSVPTDYNFTKMRVWKYEVLRDYDGEVTQTLATTTGNGVASPVNDENYDWSWNDEEDEDDYDDYPCDDADCSCHDDEDEPWDYNEDDMDDEDDYDEDDVKTHFVAPKTPTAPSDNLGKRPDGSNYWNKRSGGKFTKK
jgi:hypothetical protein